MRFLRPLSLLACAAALVSVGATAPTSTSITYRGRAYAAFLDLPLASPIVVADTGRLPLSGGTLSNTLVTIHLPAVLDANLLTARTQGLNSETFSTAEMANVVLFPGSPAQLTADLIRSRAFVECGDARGQTEIVHLDFCGHRVAVTGHPNQVFDVAGIGRLIINEQREAHSPRYHGILVNAIHVELLDGTDVILSSSLAILRGC